MRNFKLHSGKLEPYLLWLTALNLQSLLRALSSPLRASSYEPGNRAGARFSKLPVITGPVNLFYFPLRMGVSKGLKMVQ